MNSIISDCSFNLGGLVATEEHVARMEGIDGDETDGENPCKVLYLSMEADEWTMNNTRGEGGDST